MGKVSLFAGAGCLALSALIAPQTLQAQALQRSIYASALDQSGAPVPSLGPTDFVVREDKVAREILAVTPATDARDRYSIRYYLVAMLFVIFDVETVFMFPWAVIFDKLLLFGLIEMVVFIFILVVGYYYAWQKGALEWV